MTGRGSRMPPKERYLRSVYLNYQVCTDVVRHYFDGLHPSTSLVQYLLDQKSKFEKEEKKIPNYQWIQLYPEVLFRADVHIKETYLASYDRTHLKDYKEFTDRISTIFTCLFDSVDGDQKVKVVNLSRLESGEVLAKLEITSQYNPDDRQIRSALEVPVNSGNVDASLETSTDGFTFAKQGDTYRMEINLTKVNAAALALKHTKEFRIMAKRLERILLLLFDTVPGTQSVKVEEFRYLTSDCATAICKLTSEKHKDDKSLEEAISIPTSEGRLGKTLKTICTHNGFSFKEVIVFEAEINVIEKYSKTLANSNSNEFKAFANRVQPILKGLYDSVTGEQDVEIVKCRQGPSDTVHVLFHLISHGNNDEDGLRKITERKIQSGSLSLSYGITDNEKSFEQNKCIFEVTLKLAEKYSESKELANPKSEAFKSLKEKVQPEILSFYDSVCGSQEIDILKYKSSGAAHSIIFNLTSRGCSDESILKKTIETQIQTGLLGSSLKVSTSGLTFQKLTERVFYQVTLNVKRQFTDELKRKHNTEFNAFSKFVQSVLSTHYEKVPGNQEVNVVKCQQGPSGTVSTDVIIEIISHGCTDEVMVRQPIKDLKAFGKLELTLKTSPTDFSFKTVRGSKPVSSGCFDLSLLITLLRRDSNVKHPKKGYEVLPSKDDISDGAQLARIKHYRNELAHASDAKTNEHMFDDIWSNLENAIKHLGKADEKFMIAVNDALTMKLDSSPEEMLIEMVQHDKQLLELEETVTKHNEKIEKLTKQANDQSTSTKAELSGIKEEIRQKEEQILKIRTSFQTCSNLLHRLEKKYDEKFKVQDERNVQQDEMNRHMESGIEENRKDIQRLHPQSKDERKRNLLDDTEALIKEDLREGTFVITKAVTDGLSLLKQKGVLLITGHSGTGKSRMGRHVLHMFQTEDTSFNCIKLKLEDWDAMVDRSENVVVLLDDIFGETNSIYNREKDTPILDKIHAYIYKGNIKVIVTIRDTVKRHCQEVFDNHRLFNCDLINLSSDKYVLSREEKKNILTKYMKTVRQSDYTDNKAKGFTDNNGDTILKENEVLMITGENPVSGFPLVVYQFVRNDKYFHLKSAFFDRPTEIMLEEMNEIRRKGEDHRKFMIQFAVMVYTAINENCIDPYDNSNVPEITEIIKAIYSHSIIVKKGHILDAVRELKESYLINIPNQRSYRLHHPTLQESVILSFAQIDEENINKIIPLMSMLFVCKMVKPESYQEKDGEVVLRIQNNSYKLLADRLVDIYMTATEEMKIYFIFVLSNTDIFLQKNCPLLPWLLKTFEKEDNKDKYTENMIRCENMFIFSDRHAHMKIKEVFLADLLCTLATSKRNLDMYMYVLQTLKKIIETSSYHFTIVDMKTALVNSLYAICSTQNVRNVKATLEIVEENKIPVLLDQGIKLTNHIPLESILQLGQDDDDITIDGSTVFLTLCLWQAYKVFNEPVLHFLLLKYNQTPFDINLFLKMIYNDKWIKNEIGFGINRPSLSFNASLKWMIEKFKNQELDDHSFILRTACKYQMFETVEYLESKCYVLDIFCLKAFFDKVDEIPFNKKLFEFLIDIASQDPIPVVIYVLEQPHVPDYMFNSDVFRPVCLNNAKILTLACNNGHFFVVHMIIECSDIVQLDIQSALIAACKRTTRYHKYESDVEVKKLEIVKYIVKKIELELLDLKAACQQAFSLKIIEWFVQNIDTSRLDVCSIIKSALLGHRSDILEHIMNKIEIKSLDKKEVLKSVTKHYTAGCSNTILGIFNTIWYSTQDKDVLHMEEIVNTAYERKCFQLLMWIHENCHPHTSIDSKKVLFLACEDDRDDVAKWVVETFGKTSLDSDEETLFVLLSIACGERRINIINWIFATFQIKQLDIIAGVSNLLSVNREIGSRLSNLVVSILEKYRSCLETEDMKELINISLEQKHYFLVNWFLENGNSSSFNNQKILNKACIDAETGTIKMLSTSFHALNMNQAMTDAIKYFFKTIAIINPEHSVAHLELLWKEVDHNTIDIRTLVSTVCKEKNISNNLMTWILQTLILDQNLINEVLITCCQQSKICHVKYIFNTVANNQLDIKKAFVQACRAVPFDLNFQIKRNAPKNTVEMIQTQNAEPHYLKIVDYLFQMINDKDSCLDLVVNELFEKKQFNLILYFLQTGHCRSTNMNNLLKEACGFGHVKLVLGILENIKHEELDIKSAFHEACNGRHINCIMCSALMWHYTHDINMFEIDAVFKTKIESQSDKSHSDLNTCWKKWLLYINNINNRI